MQIEKKGNLNDMKIQIWPNCRARVLWPSFVWALLAVLFAPAAAPAGSVLFTAPPQLTNGEYLLRFSAQTGRVFQVQTSTNLTQWTSIATFTTSTGQAEVLVTNPVPMVPR